MFIFIIVFVQMRRKVRYKCHFYSCIITLNSIVIIIIYITVLYLQTICLLFLFVLIGIVFFGHFFFFDITLVIILLLFCRVIDVGPPKKPARRTNAEGNLSLVQRLLLYDFLEVTPHSNKFLKIC